MYIERGKRFIFGLEVLFDRVFLYFGVWIFLDIYYRLEDLYFSRVDRYFLLIYLVI